jgi:DNA-binding transcriptional ArsR family regulator
LTPWAASTILKYMLDYQERVNLAFQALADTTRRGILDEISRGPSTVAELAASRPITLAAVLQHIQVLEKAGLATTSKVGRSRTCHLDRGGLELAESWIADRRRLRTQQLDRLGDLLDEE